MEAPHGQGDAPKQRFAPWLLSAVDSGRFRGLRWTQPGRAFRVPWKHNARRDLTSADIEVFRAWAEASGRYEGCPEDPAKWKTNFRGALTSTGMFKMVEDNSKSGDDPHKVFTIVSGDHALIKGCVGHELELNPESVAPEITLPGSTNSTQSPMLEDVEVLQQVLQLCNISSHDLEPPTPSWVPAGDNPHQNTLLQPRPDLIQNDCLPLPAIQQWLPVVEQPLLGAYSHQDPMLMEEKGAMPAPCHPPEVTVPMSSAGEAMLSAPTTSPVPLPQPPEHNTDISIYYRGKLFHQEVVRGSQCLLVYQTCDPAVALRPGKLVCFPSPAGLADGKQRHFTEELLCSAGLQLEQRGCKLFATRLKKCKVFWALSQQLEGVGDPPPNLLYRDQETLIFDFNMFFTELRDFCNGQRKRSPDFTIYLCFGQSLSKHKPKESKLVLVKLVPKFCEYCYEKVLREGASSLDSGTISLQLSDSFSLFELIEQYNMQTD